MAMPSNSSDVNQPLSLEKRLPIALALMMLVLLASQYFFKPAPGPKPVTPVNNKAAARMAAKPAPATAQAQVVPEAASAAGEIQATSEIASDIDTKLYHIVFTNRGAAVKSWVLKGYRDNAGKPLELIDPAAANLGLPFTIETKDQKLSVDPNTVLYQSKLSADGTGIDYQFSNGKTRIEKSFRFGSTSFLSNVRSVVLENNLPVPHFLVWRGGFGDLKVRNAAATEQTVRYDATAGKLIRKSAKDAKNGPVTDSGNYTFAGLE